MPSLNTQPKPLLVHCHCSFSKSFPSPTPNQTMSELFCICKKPDTGRLMVGCDGCEDWFHFECIRLDPKYEKLIAQYFCSQCGDKIVWKRKCKLARCFLPIDTHPGQNTHPSKYCSERHGLEYIEGYLNRVTEQKDLQVLQELCDTGYMDDIEKFKSLDP